MQLTHKKLSRLAILLLVLSQGISSGAANGEEIGQQRQFALQQAKLGQYDLALTSLRGLVAQAPQDMGILADYIVVLSWAKQPQNALDVAKNIDVNKLPSYALNVLAKAARDTKAYDKALSIYTALLTRDATNIDAAIGRILTWVDAGDYVKSETELSILRQLYPQNVAVYQALSYLGEQSRQPILVLDANSRLIALNEQDVQAAKLLIKAAGELGATQQAFELDKKYPQAVDAARIAAIKNDEAANLIRWGTQNKYVPNLLPAERFAETDRALAKLNEVCKCDWAKPNLTDARTKNLVFDRMVALRDRHRMAEVAQHYQQLLQAKIDMPAYVLNAAGDAYLYLRQPEMALLVYNASLAKVPDNVETSFSKFYTLIELEKYADATQLIQQQAALLKPYRNRPKNPIVRLQDEKFEADNKAYFAKAYGDDLDGAEALFTKLANTGPMNDSIKLSMAEIWRWRGWHNRAQQQFKQSVKDQPLSVQAKTDLANSRIDLREWQQADTETKVLLSQYPENSAVRALDKRWQHHNMREFKLEGASNESSGGAFGSRYKDARAALYSAPFNTNYRAFVQTGYQQSTFTEGNASILYPGVGLEYTDPAWRITGAVNQPNRSNVGTELSLSADYRHDDHLSTSALLDLNSSQMPLRGLRAGVSGNLARLQTSYRWSELTKVGAGVAVMNMQDNNVRKSLSLSLDRRLITTPRYKLTMNVRADASNNSENNVTYFNPRQDLEYGLVLDNEWTLWRHYERSFTHRLQLGAGNYSQKNFGNDNTWLASYEHQWKWDDRLELTYGVMRNSHPFDGVKENFTQYFGRLNFLF